MKKRMNLLLSIIITMGLFSCTKYLDIKPDKTLAVPDKLADLQAMMDNYSSLNVSGVGSSEASSDNCSSRSAQRNSITTLRPSMYPAPLRHLRNPATRSPFSSGEPAYKNPTTGVGCSAEETEDASGAAIAVPRSAMKSRRRIFPQKPLDREPSLTFRRGLR